MTRAVVLLLLTAAAARGAAAQEDFLPVAYGSSSGGMGTVAAGSRYDAGGLHRRLFGEHYRALWTRPIQVPILDLESYAGGLTPEERGGGNQTRSLKLESGDGRDFAFRSVDKDPTPALPSVYRGTWLNRLAQDAISAAHPGGPLVASVLLDAAGVFQAEPHLFLMPDDERLKEFRAEFAGMLGYLEERPDDGFAGADRVEDWEDLAKELRESPKSRVNAGAFLTARLMDHLMGDWDRHRNQWSWAGYQRDGRTTWLPIPRDRDQVFARFDGLFLGLVRSSHPKLVVFGPEYPPLRGLAWNGQDLDRLLLPALDAEQFDSIALQLQRRLTDSVIDAAVGRLPAAYAAEGSLDLADALRARRDSLGAHARRFYRFLARDVDVWATDAAEQVDATRDDEGRLALRIAARGESDPYFERVFHPGETGEVRLHLRGGADRVTLEGGSGKGPQLRIVWEPGIDSLVPDSAARRYVVHAQLPDEEPVGSSDSTAADAPPRDWGASFGAGPRAGYDADLGLLLGAQATRTDYAFRREPYGSQIRLAVEYATAADGLRATLAADVRRIGDRSRLALLVSASEIDVVRFSGFGNETRKPGDGGAFDVDQWRLTLAPAVQLRAGRQLSVAAGPLVRYTTTDLDESPFLNAVRPRGAGGFGRVGGRVGAELDGLDSTGVWGRGARLSIGGSAFPPVWSGTGTFGELHAEAAAYLPLPIGPTPVLALRAGGKRVWGPFPYDEAAFLGGMRDLRGFVFQRFAGDAALYGGAELRIPVAWMLRDWVPTRVGVFALADAGRVWAEGTRSEKVHAAGGAGLWLSFFEERNTVSLAFASGAEGGRWYLRTGMPF